MNKDTKKLVIEHLNRLASGEISVGTTREGLCYEFNMKFDYPSLEPYFMTWRYYSGDEDYPVPSTLSGANAEEAYSRVSNLWEGIQGVLRRDLCTHIAKCLQEELDTTEETYRVGQHITVSHETHNLSPHIVYVIASIADSHIAIIDIDNGSYYNDMVKVERPSQIPRERVLQAIGEGYDFKVVGVDIQLVDLDD